ncbi:MAG: lipopolysaccharide heptosyltransferase [Pseudomonadota bacterium]|jgi:heptosyltransferase-1
MRVLIVKVSSLGDVIHTLPAVTDAYRAKRGLRFDWVVEEGYAEIPRWHPAVDKVIPVAFRRWRKNLFRTWRSGEFTAFKRNLQEHHYDLVIDAQGLIKSGVISRIAKGLTVGLSTRTIREPTATRFYNVVYTVPWQQHAVERIRDLFSRTFNYTVDYKTCDYGIDTSRIGRGMPTEKYLVFFHGTTWASKLWPDQYWQKLAQLAARDGYRVKLLWGNDEELQRAQTIAKASSNVDILGQQSLTDIARMLINSQGVVAVDTGLGHLAAALQVPVISLYGSSNHELTGTYGLRQLHLSSQLSCAPCLQKTCKYVGPEQEDEFEGSRFSVRPPCFRSNPPEAVWEKFRFLSAGGPGTLDGLFYPN